ncbi:Pentatricopeptide repeat-containing protein [Thalictrum thalictroides]|uniref:Pentatricopeptide repeat-containing protein n=1 Tax=Thalictrum thalictroides TaxID=46969 RepID=A0A7J6WQN3_THATH|nr:Pentatricopeptide repeat-containing protein [Thalictrum thalictroides]
MRGSKGKQLSSLIYSVSKNNSKTLEQTNSTTSKPSKKSKIAFRTTSSTDSVSLSSSLLDFQKQKKKEKKEKGLFGAILNIFGGTGTPGSTSNEAAVDSCKLPATDVPEVKKSQEEDIDKQWFSSSSNTFLAHRHKTISRERKEKWVFKNTQGDRFQRLVSMCGDRLGTNTTLAVFGRLKRETGQKEFKALIELCVEKARESQDEDESINHIHRAYRLFEEMKEQGFQIEDEVFGPLLLYLIDMKFEDEFYFFSEVIKEGNSAVLPRLGYYEMLFWIKVDNTDKVQELCSSIVFDADGFHLAENYLLALCETDREELLQLLEVVDITKLSSLDYVSSIFKSIGRVSLEEVAEKFILALKTSEVEADNLSYFICNYAMSMLNLAVEDVISKFEYLHEKLDVRPSITSYEKLVSYCCDSLQVHAALDIAEKMSQLDLALSVEIFYPILQAVEESCELDLVHPIYSIIRRHNLKPSTEALRILINLHVKIKDFEGAYNMLSDLKEMGIKPTSGMYNSIIAGYLREKNLPAGEMVFNQMKNADVKPDSRTFSYLIANSESEEDIIKYFEEMKSANVHATKHVYMSLINAYVNCGQFEKAKQVVLDQGVPVKNINEIKSVVVSALASSGQMSDALKFYDEMKQEGCEIDQKAVLSLIEHLQFEGELNRLLQLLEELKDPDFWFDGCERVVIYCVRHKHLSSAINLLKQLMDQDKMSIYAVLDQVYISLLPLYYPM